MTHETIHKTYEYAGGECEAPWYERVYHTNWWSGRAVAGRGRCIKPGRRKVFEFWRDADGRKMGRWHYEPYGERP